MFSLAAFVGLRWRFLSGKESHEHTEAEHRDLSGLKLSGVPEGRQIWAFDDKADKLDIDEDEMAFSASENPNSADLLFRHLQTEKWTNEGNALPDEEARPSNILDATRKVSTLRLRCAVAPHPRDDLTFRCFSCAGGGLL